MDCASAEDEAEVQESQHFDDFTLASSWERFISEIEAVCRCWLADGPKNLSEKDAVHIQNSKKLHKAKCEPKYDKKIYCMEYYFEEKCRSKVVNWDCSLHDLQLAFGVSEFLIIAPKSASGVILDSPEASKLLSAVAIALSNCSSRWPAFVPVHDPSRKAYIGIQNMGTVFTRRFESDCIKSQVPVKLMHLEGLYELFVSKFAFSAMDLSLQLFRVQFTMKLTYRTLSFNDDDEHMSEAETENTGSSADFSGDPHNRSQWDDDCPWSEWYSAEDPVKGFELITIWSERTLESSLEMAEIENSSPQEAERWLLLPSLGILNDDCKAREVGFASQLSLLVDALETSFEAQFLEDFVSVESSAETVRSSAAVPPPTVVDRVLKELFHEVLEVVDFDKNEHRSCRAIKGAPLGSLFAQFCLHSLWFGNCNIRAIALLWIEFVREVRWCWEESQPLPKIPTNGVIDLSFCLIHQKLQMLAMCIEQKREVDEEFSHPIGDKYEQSGHRQVFLLLFIIILISDVTVFVKAYMPMKLQQQALFQEDFLCKTGAAGSSNEDNSSKGGQDVLCDPGETTENTNALEMTSDRIRRGSAGIAGSMMLLNSQQRIHVPFTQDAPPMTEDMHEERLNAVAAFGDSFNLSAQLEREILQSGDWESDTIEDSSVSGAKMNDDWPPRGRLSSRMSEHGNFWRKLWNDAPALTASEQKPLFDANREGEKILHYLETLRPRQLLEQMVCTAFRATSETLNQTAFGNVDIMKSKLDQLCLTMASVLRPLQGSQLSQDGEVFEDLKQLCATFQNTERFTILAASLHRKFVRSPRLSREIFSDYNNFYLLKVGNGAVEDDIPKEFEQKQEVRIEERNVVADLFVPPSANQSWRKVISMGNLLNGHEPELREIIFGMREEVDGSYYTGHSPVDVDTQRDIETYRMYVRGTSNNLGVALAVVSYD